MEAGYYPADATVEQIMSPEILYCRDSDAADDVTNIMAENQLRRLAVLDASKQLVGMVTLGDLLNRPKRARQIS